MLQCGAVNLILPHSHRLRLQHGRISRAQKESKQVLGSKYSYCHGRNNRAHLPDISYSEYRRSLKTFLFGQWGHGAVWTLLTAPTRNILTYLLYLLTPITWLNPSVRSNRPDQPIAHTVYKQRGSLEDQQTSTSNHLTSTVQPGQQADHASRGDPSPHHDWPVQYNLINRLTMQAGVTHHPTMTDSLTSTVQPDQQAGHASRDDPPPHHHSQWKHIRALLDFELFRLQENQSQIDSFSLQ